MHGRSPGEIQLGELLNNQITAETTVTWLHTVYIHSGACKHTDCQQIMINISNTWCPLSARAERLTYRSFICFQRRGLHLWGSWVRLNSRIHRQNQHLIKNFICHRLCLHTWTAYPVFLVCKEKQISCCQYKLFRKYRYKPQHINWNKSSEATSYTTWKSWKLNLWAADLTQCINTYFCRSWVFVFCTLYGSFLFKNRFLFYIHDSWLLQHLFFLFFYCLLWQLKKNKKKQGTFLVCENLPGNKPSQYIYLCLLPVYTYCTNCLLYSLHFLSWLYTFLPQYLFYILRLIFPFLFAWFSFYTHRLSDVGRRTKNFIANDCLAVTAVHRNTEKNWTKTTLSYNGKAAPLALTLPVDIWTQHIWMDIWMCL